MRMRISTEAKAAVICFYRLRVTKNSSIQKDLVWKEDLMNMEELKREIATKGLAQQMMLNRRVGHLRNLFHRRPMSVEVIFQDNRSLQCLNSAVMSSKKVTKTYKLKLLAPCIKEWQSRVPTKTIRIKSHKLISQVSSVPRPKITRIHNLRQHSTLPKALLASHQWVYNSYQIVNSFAVNQQLQIKLYPIAKVNQRPFRIHLREGRRGY